MSGFALLWGKILDSSLWINGTKEMKLLFIAMLAMKDSDGCIYASLVGLADRAKITRDECRAALASLLADDPDDTSGVENGRRLRVIHGGWQIVNHDLYRFSTIEKREFWRQQKADQRAREEETRAAHARDAMARHRSKDHLKRGTPQKGETAYNEAEKNGASQEQLDAMVTNSLPTGNAPEDLA